MASLRTRLEELDTLERLIPTLPGARVRVVRQVEHKGELLPIHSIVLGPDDPSVPTLGLFGGVHGLERVGTQVLLSYLGTLHAALQWDATLRQLFEGLRLVIVPLVNPVGMALGYRSNGRGVDLMRNAPVQAEARGHWLELYRGQRLTRWLPWYRGTTGTPMEPEAQALCDVVRQEVLPSDVAITLDVHSGFLQRDRIWFPYARSQRLFPNIADLVAFEQLLRETHRYHRYTVEPQSLNYTTHGDLWDFLYDEQRQKKPEALFLPLTLELSSSSWYRKNPRQLLTRTGLFHPIKQHRLTRVLRRHKSLFDFLLRALYSHAAWVPRSPQHRSSLEREAELLWTSTP